MTELIRIPEASDFLAESEATFRLLVDRSSEAFSQPTQFKEWTFNDIIGHLHLWNVGAMLSLNNEAGFQRHVDAFWKAIDGGESRVAYTKRWLAGRQDHDLLMEWKNVSESLADQFSDADPKLRVKWVGPGMSARSSITARLMETWAHSQAIYDSLGQVRDCTDSIRSIAVLGVNTRVWTFANRGLTVPDTLPYVCLIAPSGVKWTWGLEDANESVRGSAEEFCQVITQTRHVDDTSLLVQGEGAQSWMSLAQCFAGSPVDPPLPGTRCIGLRP